MKKIFLITSVTLLSLSTSVSAQMGGRMMPVFADLDTDQSGSLSMEEMNAMPARRGGDPAQRFAMFDTDESGEVSEEEFNNFFANMRGRGMGMGG